jgi:hypothetical protein
LALGGGRMATKQNMCGAKIVVLDKEKYSELIKLGACKIRNW